MLARILCVLIGAALAARAADPGDLRTLATQKLHEALQADVVFVRVHAAEALISENMGRRAREVFLAEEPAAGKEPIRRIGIWRVLANASLDADERNTWINRLKSVALDPAAKDRTHAVESLAKLHVQIPASERSAYHEMAEESAAGYSIFAWWVLHNSGEPKALERITAALVSSDPIMRLRAAYIIRLAKASSPENLTALNQALSVEPPDSPAYPYVLSATTLLETDADRRRILLTRLEHIAFHGTHGARYEACQTLMGIWHPADAPRLASLLTMHQTDSLVAGAWTILHLTSPLRNNPK